MRDTGGPQNSLDWVHLLSGSGARDGPVSHLRAAQVPFSRLLIRWSPPMLYPCLAPIAPALVFPNGSIKWVNSEWGPSLNLWLSPSPLPCQITATSARTCTHTSNAPMTPPLRSHTFIIHRNQISQMVEESCFSLSLTHFLSHVSLSLSFSLPSSPPCASSPPLHSSPLLLPGKNCFYCYKHSVEPLAFGSPSQPLMQAVRKAGSQAARQPSLSVKWAILSL